MTEQRKTLSQNILLTLAKWISYASFFLLVFVFALDLGYPAYLLFGFLILYYATLLLYIYAYQQKTNTKTSILPLMFCICSLLPFLVVLLVAAM
jgi:hypothetical protein